MTDTERLLEIETATDGDTGNLFAYFVRGHIDPAAFHEQIAHDYDPCPMPPIGYVRHTAWRNVPRGDGWMEYVEGRGRGAYPVTVLEVAQYKMDLALPRIIAQNEANHAAWCPGCSEDAPCYRMRALILQRARWSAAQTRAAIQADEQREQARAGDADT